MFVSSYTALKLPKSLEDLCRDVYAHFHRSLKRQDVYREFQTFYDVEPHKFLSPTQTRWLSLHECINRLLEQYEALILASLQNRFIQMYLQFLSYQLERLNEFHRLFQMNAPSSICLSRQWKALSNPLPAIS